DLIGYGSSAAWPQQAAFGLEVELRAIEQSLQCCADTFHLVGYSYGGVLALQLALADPRRVQSLTLIEPVFFAALKYAGDWTSYFEFCRVRDEFVAALARGDRELAMRRFVDFWMGNDAWLGLPADARASMLRAADKIVLDWQASFAADPGRARLSALAVRTLLVRGSDSPRPNALPGRRIARDHSWERTHGCGRRKPPVAADPRLGAHERDTLKPARRRETALG